MSASDRPLWYGLAAPVAAWVMEGMASFVFSDYACAQGKPFLHSFSRTAVVAALIVLAAVMLTIAISAGVVAWRTWRSLSRTAKVSEAEGRGRGEFMALTGIFISVIFSIAIVWSGLAPMIVGPCTVSR